jgi:polygalacturonase
VPAGNFLIGTLELKSNVTLHIAAAGKLLGSGAGQRYHAVDAIPLSGDSTLEDGNWALIFAVNAKNVTVEGPAQLMVRESSSTRPRAVQRRPAAWVVTAGRTRSFSTLSESHRSQY